jgi:hypothetical protein
MTTHSDQMLVGYCAAKDCGKPLTLGDDGLVVGCEHTGQRNLSWAEQQDARRARDGEQLAIVLPHPDPVVRSRPHPLEDLPGGAKTFARVAIKAGWTVAPAYARGTVPGQAHVSDSYLLRLARGTERAVACWSTDAAGKVKVDAVWLVKPELRHLTTTQLKAYVVRDELDVGIDAVLDRLEQAKL